MVCSVFSNNSLKGIEFAFIGWFTLNANGLNIPNGKFPYLKIGIFSIAGIYIFRGIGEILFHTISEISRTSETIQSLVALIIGLLYLFGGIKKWNAKY